MAIPPILTSIHGRDVGLDKDRNLVARVGLKAAKLISDVTALTTGAVVSNGGLGVIGSSAAGQYNLEAPVAGVEKQLVLSTTSTSTAARTVVLQSGTLQSTASSTYNTMTFNGTGQAISLIGLSTARYTVLANAGVTLS